MPHDQQNHAGQDHGEHDHGHSHAPAAPKTPDAERRLLIALAITAAFMVVEAGGGWLANSLALLADAGHMLTDVAALAFAWVAARMARRPGDARRSYGYGRVQVLAAFVNGLMLFAIAVLIVVEAADRLMAPPPVVAGAIMLVIAAVGLAANIGAFLVLQGGDRRNLNVRGAAAHVIGDMLGSVGAIAAGLVILATGWTPIDPILSVVVSLLILRSAWAIVRESGHVLVEGTPKAIDAAVLRTAILDGVPDVVDVHHVHAWSLTPEHPIVTLHAQLRVGSDSDRAIAAINRLLQDRFAVDHVTVQIELEECADVPAASLP